MGLPAGQQRILEKIEVKLTQADPRLNSLFAIFTRLTHTEAMPWIEQLKASPLRDTVTSIRFRFRSLSRRPVARMRALLLLPAALVAMVCALTISFGLTGSHRPAFGAKVPTARELVVKDRLCRLSLVRVPVLAC
ncbi:MAG TPA: hypothetical protein VIV12_21170 [Streptosporangiaceae bacterium]